MSVALSLQDSSECGGIEMELKYKTVSVVDSQELVSALNRSRLLSGIDGEELLESFFESLEPYLS